jgi:sugar phosphate isomerase/epimerase
VEAPRLSVQLYSVREHLEDLDGTLARIAAIGFDAVEPFNVLDGSLGAALRRHGLEAQSAQFPFLSDDIDFMGARVQLPPAEVVFDAAANLGVGLLVDPMVEAVRWQTADDVDRTVDRLNAAVDQAATYGLRVGYHNHSFEFHARFDGATAYEHFAARLDDRAVLELDLFWAAAAQQDVAALVRRLGTRVRALHVKDGAVPADPFAEPSGYEPAALDQRPAGQGELAVSEVLTAARFVELDVVEFDHIDGDVFDAIGASADFIREVRSR